MRRGDGEPLIDWEETLTQHVLYLLDHIESFHINFQSIFELRQKRSFGIAQQLSSFLQRDEFPLNSEWRFLSQLNHRINKVNKQN